MITSGCITIERQALLSFKARVEDPQHGLSSWEGQDCCQWRGVECDNHSSHIIKLNLQNYDGQSSISGEIDPSLLSLSHLKYLDLSMNHFHGARIPEFIGSFKNLRYLDLSWNSFSGKIPTELGNLSSLRHLDLRGVLSNPSSSSVDNLRWLSKLSSLKFLDLSLLNLTTVTDCWQAVNMLPSLRAIACNYCGLSSIPSSLSFTNFTSLEIFAFGGNNFNSTLPHWLWKLGSLTYLDFSDCGIRGPIPDALGNLVSLRVLQLGYNPSVGMLPRSFINLHNLSSLDLTSTGIDGDIRELVERLSHGVWSKLDTLELGSNKLRGNLSGWLEQMTLLRLLNLRNNSLNGTIPSGIGKLSNLSFLDLAFNFFKGVISEAHFEQLTSLNFLDLSTNSLSIEVDYNWVPPFKLQEMGFNSCYLGPRFPAWLRSQSYLSTLNMSHAGIVDTIPDWFWNFSSSLGIVDLSYNQIGGKLPASLEFTELEILALVFNKFEGPIPSLPNTIGYVLLCYNNFSGPLPSVIGGPNLIELFLSNNQINGSIPSHICNLKSLIYLDLSNNHLSAEVPHCWNSSQNLIFVNFAYNNLSGEIPQSMGSLSLLKSLHLNGNSLSGELPSSLQHCKKLTVLDLGENKFRGSIPAWIGESLQNLVILRLRSNIFVGTIPPELARLSSLQILDFADNHLTGAIPRCFGNFTAMASNLPGDINELVIFSLISHAVVDFQDSISIVTKGERLRYSKTLYLVKSMDLSSNSLSGEVPEDICDLFALENLNLSENHLAGRIPKKIGAMQSLESLDLSMNEFSGSIPASIANLTALSHLNLSYNNLSGRIPSGYQLQTLDDPSIYVGNAALCGLPVSNGCSNDEPTIYRGDGDYEDGSEAFWFHLSIGVGFTLGLWGVFCVLLFKRDWRYNYFRMIDNVYDRLYVLAAVSMGRLKRKRTERY